MYNIYIYVGSREQWQMEAMPSVLMCSYKCVGALIISKVEVPDILKMNNRLNWITTISIA